MAMSSEQTAAIGQAAHSRGPTRVNAAATPSVLAFAADAITRSALTAACDSNGLVAAVHPGGVEACLQCIGEIPPGTTVIVDFDGCDIPEADGAVIATLSPTGVRLIATAADPKIRGALAEAGFGDFLLKPATTASVSSLFGGLIARPSGPRPPEPRRSESHMPDVKAPELRRAETVANDPAKRDAPAKEMYAETASEPDYQTHKHRTVDPRAGVSAAPSERLHQALTRTPRSLPVVDSMPGRIVAVIGVRGGVGASSLAANIACSMAKDFSQRTALIDLDFSSGTQLLAVNAQTGSGLRESLETPSRLDSQMVDRLAIKLNEDLHLFGAEDNPDAPALTDANSAAELIRHIAAQYRRVVIDVPRTMPALLAASIALADEIILVGDLTLAGARDLLRTFAWLHRARPEIGLRLVSGGATPPKRELVIDAEFRRLCGRPLDLAIPFDAGSAADASRSGRPIIAVNSKIAKAIRALVTQIEGVEPPRRSFAFWRSKQRGTP